MRSGMPWSVKGVAPGARRLAKESASKAGMTIGQWLTGMIEANENARPQSQQDKALEELKAHVQQLEQRLTQAYSGLVKALEVANQRMTEMENNDRPRRPSSLA